MKKAIGELKISHEKHHIVDELSSLLYSNEITIGEKVNTEKNHFNDKNHKARQKKTHIKKIIKSKKKPKFKKRRINIKSKPKNMNNYVKNKKKNLNTDLKEFYNIFEEMKTQSNSPEKKAQFQKEGIKKMSFDFSPELEKESINRCFEVNANIKINKEDNCIASSEKDGAFNIGKFGALNQNNRKEDGYSFPIDNKNETNGVNSRENHSFKKNTKNTINKKLFFSPEELIKANINKSEKFNNKENREEDPISIFKGFEILYENSIDESNEISSNSKENNFNPYKDDYQNIINIDEINNLIHKDCNEDINLDLFDNINCNFRNKKNN